MRRRAGIGLGTLLAAVLAVDAAAYAQPPPGEPEVDEPAAPEADDLELDATDEGAQTGEVEDLAAVEDDLSAQPSEGDEVAAEAPPEDDLVLEEPLPLEAAGPSLFDTRIYGFIDAQYRHQIGDKWPPAELRPPAHQPGFDVTPTLMVQGTVAERFRYYLNLAAPFGGSPVEDISLDLRNAWVEAALLGDYLNVRVGKTYRRFGLYNEILDATPTFLGTEPPAYLNPGQLLLTRTTNLMIHGTVASEEHGIHYALMTGNDEVGGEALPLGADLRYALGERLLVGASFYWSGAEAKPTRDVGEGPTHGGVINYMDEDEFIVFGGFGQLRLEGLLVQGAYFRARHDARRNPMKVVAIATMTPVGMRLNQRQRERLFDGASPPTPDDVNVETTYTVQTAYVRVGYEILIGDMAALTPYVHIDWYRHQEAIPGPPVGGNEAGLSDDAQFYRLTPGLMLRPIPAVALKGEYNTRMQTIAGNFEVFHEIRASLSYLWEL